MHYIDGISLAQDDPQIDTTGLTTALVSHLHSKSRQLWTPKAALPLKEAVTGAITSHPRKTSSVIPSATQETLSFALSPLAITEKLPLISVLDAPVSMLATDVAPYVRSIALYDLWLEQQRKELSGAGDGKGTKARKTRASWAALEGGDKASTRREKWWKREVDLRLVLRTAGMGWGEAVRRVLAEQVEEVRVGEGRLVDGQEVGSGRMEEGEKMDLL